MQSDKLWVSGGHGAISLVSLHLWPSKVGFGNCISTGMGVMLTNVISEVPMEGDNLPSSAYINLNSSLTTEIRPM